MKTIMVVIICIFCIGLISCDSSTEPTVEWETNWQYHISTSELYNFIDASGTVTNTGSRNITHIDLKWKITYSDFTTGTMLYEISINLPPGEIFEFNTNDDLYAPEMCYGDFFEVNVNVEEVKLIRDDVN